MLKRVDWTACYFAFVISIGLLVATGMVPDIGCWYSNDLAQRQQTEALIHGRFALSYSPGDLGHDECWSGGGVQQVWGLGVSFWRLPFELLARTCGFDAFPDRLAFGIGIFCIGFWVFRTFARWRENEVDAKKMDFTGLAACFLVILFPPFVALLCSRMAVYEEVAAYAFLYGIALMLGLIQFVRQPGLGRWMVLCLLSGFGPFLRPTLTFYGMATVVIAWLRLRWGTPVAGFPKFRFLPNARWWLGPCVFALGGMLLFLSNQQRFGSGLEFGHRLNLQTGDSLFGSMYATRFDHPYEREPLPSASKELFGAMFLDQKFNGYNWYQSEIFPGQSPTVRWREFYLCTYDVSYFVLIVVGCVLGLLCFKNTSGEDAPPTPEVRYLAIWSIVATAILAAFYLRTPAIASRYMLDFAPAFVAAILALYLRLSALFNTPRKRLLWLAAMVVWLIVQIACSAYVNKTKSYGASWTGTYAEIKERLPDFHSSSDPLDNQFETHGWNTNNGDVRVLAAVFVRDPEFIELHLVPREKKANSERPEVVRAKIGTEFLKRESIEDSVEGWKLRFHGPMRADYQKGLQVTFIAFTPKERLSATNAPYYLTSVRWGEGETKILKTSKDIPSH